MAGDIAVIRDPLTAQLLDTEKTAIASDRILDSARLNDSVARELGVAASAICP